MATELAKAYVQIVPSAQGISGKLTEALGGEADSAGKQTGQSLGSKLVGTLKAVIVSAAIGKALADTISQGAELEQSIGGIETLFKDSADAVKRNAADAYRTAGMSANDYMQLTTSFSASLLQSLGNDTAAAADVADMAMTDMSDNANKMGTDMGSITDAYKGFAKQNYTMLDNLKLGYGGTKTEMQRLLADAQKITGIKYNIDNLSDVYEAIHVIQGELDITGTTALEASETIAGSAAAMKAAFANVMGQLTLGQDVGPALTALAQTVTTFLVGNLLPAVWNILKALPGALVAFAQALIPQLVTALMEFVPQLNSNVTASLPQMLQKGGEIVDSIVAGVLATLPAVLQSGVRAMQTLITSIGQNLPAVLQKGVEIINNLVNGVLASLPQILQAALQVMTSFLQMLIQNFPSVLRAGVDILLNMVNGIINTLPQIVQAAAETVATLLNEIVAHLPEILQTGFELIVELIAGMGSAGGDLITAVVELATSIWDTICAIDWLQLGADIIRGIINGIGSMAGALWEAAQNIASSAFDAITGFFGIASPSKLMRDEVGRFIPAGIAAGIQRNLAPVRAAVQELSEMSISPLQTELTGTVSAGSRIQAAAVPANAASVTLYQNITTHDSLSPAELTREAQNFLSRAKWRLP